jgi:hypothetical protein
MQVGPDPAHPTGDFLKRGRLYQEGLSGSRVIRKPRDENIDCCYRLPWSSSRSGDRTDSVG